ncbi:MAG: hypothetical protein JNK81_08715 [Anaerolineales bacterium]|nr:hypothetical protein [Anaerolineales bacterium]
MLSKLTSNQKILLIAFALILLIGISICIASILFFTPSSTTEEPTAEPYTTIQYCRNNLQEVCLLSFGRDIYGNAVINVFIPNEEFPEFYLRIVRTTDEIIYVCTKSESSTIICKGDALNLGERVEIFVTSTESYQIIAQGTFLIKAIYISPEINEPATDSTPTPLAEED